MSRLSISSGLLLLLILQTAPIALPQQRDTLVQQIEEQIRVQKYDQALAAVQSGLRTAPRDARLWTLEGIVLSLTGKTAQASEAFKVALRISPGDPAALRGEAEILYRSQDQHAVPLLKLILKENPGDSTAHAMLATLDARNGRCGDAVEQFDLGEEAVSSHPPALEAWGVCLMHLRRPSDAVPIFQRLESALPDANWPRYDLAVALVESKQDTAALKALGPLLEKMSTDPDVLSLASEAYEVSGNTPKAVALLRQAIVLNPHEPRYYLAFAALCMSHESFQVGVDMLDIGVRQIPGNAALYISRGTLYAQMARYNKAEADFGVAEKLDSAQSISAYATDLARLQKNKSDLTVSGVRSQLKDHPNSPSLNYLLAKLVWSNGAQADKAAMADARRHAESAVRLKPDMSEARDLLADIEIAAAQYGAAAEQCRLVLRVDPSDQTAVYHLIVALRHTNQETARGEIPALVRQLSALQQQSLKQEIARKSFSLIEEKSPSSQ